MLLNPTPTANPASTDRPVLDVGLSVRARGLAGAAATAIVLAGVLLGDIPFGPTAWVALAGSVVCFGGVAWRPIARLFERAGGAVATVIGTLLVLGTGGTSSPFIDMYAIILVYSAVVMSWRRVVFDTVVVASAVTLTGVLSSASQAYYVDGVIDLSVWVTIAVLAGGLSRRLAAIADRQRADAALVDAANTALITTDERGLVTGWNPAAAAMYGTRREGALGRHVADVVGSPADDPARAQTGQLDQIRYATRHRDGRGSAIDVEVTAWPVPRTDGERGTGMGMLVQDVSLHRTTDLHLRRERERFRTMAEQSNGVVYRFEVGPPAGLSYLSPRMHDLLGLDHLAVQADPTVVLSRIHPDDGVPFDLSDGSGRFEVGVHTYRVQHADGSWVWIEDRHQPELDKHGCLIASQGILHDVSARKQLEEARDRALADAQETARQLERTTLAQSVFLRSVSHQLRTPMTLVRGFSTTLQRRGDQLDPTTREMLLQRLLKGIERLDEHLSDLLDMQATDDESPLQGRELVDVADLCFEAVDATDTNQHRVVVDARPGTVHGDRGQLSRAVASLLRNSIQHTPPGTTIHVTTEVERDTVRLAVTDDGPGLDPEIADRVFDPFVQGRAAATAPSPGAGIGLTFVRQVALRHGGTATHSPVQPTGSRFVLALPAARTATQSSQTGTGTVRLSP